MTENTYTERSRWLALYVLCASVLMIVLDITVVNVALPSIQNDLGFTQSSLAWVINAYVIAFGGLLLLAGRLGDLISKRGVFLVGLAIFTFASLICALAQSQEMLLAARFVQGIGGALASAVVLGMIVTMFSEPREQAKAIGIYGFVASAGGSVGLVAGGLLTEVNWHWIFAINVPIGIATALLARRLLVKDKGIGLAQGADVLGAVLITSSLMLLVYTIVKPAAEKGWGATETLVLGAVALALLAAFIVREATARTPLMPLRMFRSRNVSGANVIQAVSVAGMFALFFLGSLYLQRVEHYTPLQIGLAFLPATLVMGTMSIKYSEPIVMRFGPKKALVGGLTLILLTLILFTRTPVDGNYVSDILPAMIPFGLGAGVAFPALMNVAMSSATPSDAGLASGLINTTAQVGAALGLAVLATISATRADHLLAAGKSTAEALNGGYHLAYVIGAGLILAAITVAVTVLRSDRMAVPAHHEAAHAEPAYSEAA
jgi:EmrB/QacA subfamily drug resistance transporter